MAFLTQKQFQTSKRPKPINEIQQNKAQKIQTERDPTQRKPGPNSKPPDNRGSMLKHKKPRVTPSTARLNTCHRTETKHRSERLCRKRTVPRRRQAVLPKSPPPESRKTESINQPSRDLLRILKSSRD
ncbi:hypothetical protein Rs2_47413 [Raphanus sativus]|nr:hypothetical protein Rs2_47413 [Raphanus sativus]